MKYDEKVRPEKLMSKANPRSAWGRAKEKLLGQLGDIWLARMLQNELNANAVGRRNSQRVTYLQALAKVKRAEL